MSAAFKRWINKYVNDIQAYGFRNARMVGFPSRICIDPTNYCQLSCPLCPTGTKEKKVQKGNLSFENYLKLVDEIGDYLYKITFYNWGEPLLNPDIVKCVKDAAGRGIRTNISTNLNYYTDEMLVELVKSGLYKLTVSLDGASQDTYEIYRKNGNYLKVIEGIKKINQIKADLNTKYPILLWQYILMAHNEHHVDEARRLAGDLNMEFRLKAVSLDEGNPEQRDRWYPQNEQYQKLKHNANNHQPYIDRCIELWNSPVINWNGELFPCCHVFGDEYGMGNVFADGFKKTWNNTKMVTARKAVMNRSGQRVEVYCKVCPDRRAYRSFKEFKNALSKKGTTRRNIFDHKGDHQRYKDWNTTNTNIKSEKESK